MSSKIKQNSTHIFNFQGAVASREEESDSFFGYFDRSHWYCVDDEMEGIAHIWAHKFPEDNVSERERWLGQNGITHHPLGITEVCFLGPGDLKFLQGNEEALKNILVSVQLEDENEKLSDYALTYAAIRHTCHRPAPSQEFVEWAKRLPYSDELIFDKNFDII